LLEQAERERAERGEVRGSISGADSTVIFAERDNS